MAFLYGICKNRKTAYYIPGERTGPGSFPDREDDGTYTVFFTVMKEETDYWQHMGETGYILDTGFDSVGKLSVRIVTKK